MVLAGSRMTGEGVLLIDSREHRTQARTARRRRARLAALVEQATRRPEDRAGRQDRSEPRRKSGWNPSASAARSKRCGVAAAATSKKKPRRSRRMRRFIFSAISAPFYVFSIRSAAR